ncbi:MAG: hypothetical protein A2X56_10570 [Nitrospirae bacterium GWC2_57_13]|jgi:hypothetical protein|nr:MAG: hypothetical protein A2X56_10570 [Nitrospirae bacterium GWC2_57_13]OGW46418.1 MAG: hypothetical protein A2X57_03385 [Nitrospirae bacterium GWD2_57_8]HAR38102.1 hypothetical protein [Porphyromonadaceae bacterium]
MRYFIGLVILFAWLGTAHALTPLPDSSPVFFAGEWAGTGEQGAYCYLNLSADGWGWVLIDGGAGDWFGARIQWRNRQQSLQVEKIIPLTASTQRRIMPLAKICSPQRIQSIFEFDLEHIARRLPTAKDRNNGTSP